MLRRRMTLALSLLVLTGGEPLFAGSKRFFESAGVPICYEVIGTGRPVVFLHGFGGRFDPELFPELLEGARGRQLIGLDVRGFGLSGKPEGEEAYGRTVVDDLVRLLDHLGLEQVDLIGYSMGGIISLKAAALYPHRIGALVLVGQGWVPKEDLERMAGYAVRLAHTPADRLTTAQSETIKRHGLHVLTGFASGYPQLFVTPQEVDALTQPILAVIGSEDSRLARAHSLSERRPEVRLAVIPERNHGNVIADPRFSDVISDFLSGLLR